MEQLWRRRLKVIAIGVTVVITSCSGSEVTPPTDQLVPTTAAVGAPDCVPPTPHVDWVGSDGEKTSLVEVQARSADLEVWGLLWQMPPLEVGVEVKMVWRVTGSGEFTIRAMSRGAEADLTWGPNFHAESNFDRPGDEWGTAFVFPEPGCWEIQITRGTGRGYVWVQVSG